MGKKTKLIEFLANSLNDSSLKENCENISLDMIVSNAAPKRTSKPLTQLSIKNELSAILELSKTKKKIVNKKVVTKSAKKPKVATKSKSKKSIKTKKRS